MTRPLLLLSTLAILAAPMSWAQDTTAPESASPEAGTSTPEAGTSTPETGNSPDAGAATPQADSATPDAGTPDADAADSPQAEQLPPSNVLDTGEPADGSTAGATPAQGDNTYTKTTSGAWDIQCLRVEEGEEPCQMYQLLKDQQGSNVAEVSLFKVSGGGQVVAGATFVVPLETLLTQKMTIAVDNGAAKRYDFSFCTQVGCYARVGFTAAEVAAFKAGVAGKVTIVPALAPDQKVTVDMSLNGFTAAFDQITAIQQ